MLRSIVLSLVLVALSAAGAARGATFTTLYRFCSLPNCTDGSVPMANFPNTVYQPGGLLLVEGAVAGAPAIFGTASLGGANGQGAAFKLTPNTRAIRTTEAPSSD